MGSAVSHRLHFEEKDGLLSARLPADARLEIADAANCLPWSKNGERGLLYCSMKTCRQAEQEIRSAIKESPLFAQIICKVVHRPVIDESGVLHIPRAAARFAQLGRDAVLSRIAEGYLLLKAEEPNSGQRPNEGKVIQADF